MTVPTTTYRLQLNRNFTFAEATAIVPYLSALGVSHVHTSPYLKARTGSSHGYDVVDHNALNPEIGSKESFDTFVDTLHAHGMGQILDIVPNHMGVGGNDNVWWLDVLENGPASPYADYFDIDWHPVREALRNKILLPFLGDHYGSVLTSGQLQLELDAERGHFSVRYHDHRFPIDPRTYPHILGYRIKALANRPERETEGITELKNLISRCESVPPRNGLSPERRQERLRGVDLCKRQLAELYSQAPVVRAFLCENVAQFNGVPGQPHTFDRLHRLLEIQAYRLAHWQVASDEINYRRFFNINDLAGIRMENEEAFHATHRFMFELVAEGKVNGLRIDHPDGLYDPLKYCTDLHHGLRAALERVEAGASCVPYVVVEKILARYERLPDEWPVSGTTGYDFANLVNGLQVYPGAERQLQRLYARFIGYRADFDELLYQCKRLIIRVQLSSDLTVLANLLDGIAQTSRQTRDFTLNGLRAALTEVVACFPVYRTYVRPDHVTRDDQRFVQWAVAQAKKRSPAASTTVFDFIQGLLLLEHLEVYPPDDRRRVIHFVMRFQQYTSPVMAKAMEDTAFYVYNCLVSLNDVGGDPRSFGVSPAAFHRANRERAEHRPNAIITTSTHDSKRSEDIRARINVLSELPDEWRRHLGRWGRLNRSKKRTMDKLRVPVRNDEYLLYQTLLGAWPLEDLDERALATFRERIESYMLKAIREAKEHTSWINPSPEYEEAMLSFVRALLREPEKNAFLTDFLPFQRHVARFGLFNALSQSILKLASPGVPQTYQGNELWTFSLVDPDNRRAVDYGQRQMLQEPGRGIRGVARADP